MIKKITHLLIVLVICSPFYLSMFNTSVFAAACPVTDGGAGDGDGVVNGIITINADTTWTADGTNLGSFDCSGLEIKVTNSKTLALASYDNGDADWTNDYGVSITAANFTVDLGSTVSGNETGYPGGGLNQSGTGPGGGEGGVAGNGAGGSHGGTGGQSSSWGGATVHYGGVTYDSLSVPIDLGSGGAGSPTAGSGGAGGGAIKITVTGTIKVDGSMTANGGNASCPNWCQGAGSGGSIYLASVNLQGGGTITANGGAGAGALDIGGSGGGGRIAIFFSGANTSTITPYAVAGSGNSPGTNGTAFLEDTTNHDLTVPSANGIWRADGRASWTFRNISIAGDIGFQSVNGVLLTIKSTGTTTIPDNSTFTLISSYADNSGGGGIYFDLEGDVTIPVNTTFNTDARGYAGGSADTNGSGPGGGGGNGGTTGNGGGGGHGGSGGAGDGNGISGAAGASNDSLIAPMFLGSGGGGGGSEGTGKNPYGGVGGGAIKISVTGTLTINGTITANGASGANPNYVGGAGAGGSIYFVGQNLAGNGTIRANGGNGLIHCCGEQGGNGAGGRIALEYAVSNNFIGNSYANVGSGGNGGENGTISIFGFPVNPTSLAQYKSNGITLITTGSSTNETSVVLKMSMTHDIVGVTLTPKFEVQPVGTLFTNTATDIGSGVVYSGVPVTGSSIVTGLSDITSYHWQAKVCDETSNCSSWVSYPDTSPNAESAIDFQVVLNQNPDTPTSLGGSSMVDGSSGSDNTPALSFSLSDPDVGNTVQYQIQIDDTADFSSPVTDYTSSLAAQGARTFTVGQDAGSGSYTTGQSGQTLSDGSYYWRVKAIDNSSASSSWISANSGSVAFIIDTATPTFSLSSPSGTYISDGRPTFKWKASTESTANLSKYKLEIDNGTSGSFSIDGIAVSGTSSTVTDKYIISYEGFGDSDNTNNYISVVTKSDNMKLIEGKRAWKVTLTDQAGNEQTESATVFVDQSGPSVSYTYSGGVIAGRATDSLNGDSATTKVASGVEKVSFLIEKSLGSTYTFVYSADIYPAANYSESTGAVLTDNSANTSGKYVTFSFSPSINLNGTYRVTVSASDKAGNSSSQQESLSMGATAVLTVTPTLVPELLLTPTLPVEVTPTFELTPTPTELPTPTPTSVSVATIISETISQTYDNTVEAITAAVDNVKERVTRIMEVLGDSIQTNILDNEIVNQTSKKVEETRSVLQHNPVASQSAIVAAGTTQVAAAAVVASGTVSTVIAIAQTASSVSHILEAVSMLESKGLVTTIELVGGQFFTTFLGGIFIGKKRRRSVGIAYDSVTNLPLAGALLVFFSQGGNLKLVTTNNSGRFQVAAAEDEYEMRAEKVGYEFPSKMVLVPQNETYASIYLPGQKFHLGPLSQSNIAVPLDPKVMTKASMNRMKIFLDNLRHLLLGQKNFLLPLVSLLMSGYAAFVFPTLANKALFLIIFLWQVWQVHRDLRKTAAWGCVFDRNNKPLENYTIKLYLYNNQMKDFYALSQTDAKGRYLFVPENGEYVMEICDPKMQVLKEGTVKVTDENPKVDLMIKLSDL